MPEPACINGVTGANGTKIYCDPKPGTVYCPKVTPTKTTGTTGILKFRISFSGVTTDAACAKNWKVDVMVREWNGNRKTYYNIPITTDGMSGNLMAYKGEVPLVGIVSKTNLAVLISGPKHVRVNYTFDNQSSVLSDSRGYLSVDSNPNITKVHDFTKLPLLAGDVNMDGVINMTDYEMVKTDLTQRTNMRSDLNGNCQLESMDLVQVVWSMNEQQLRNK
jgi:hypothetical protein